MKNRGEKDMVRAFDLLIQSLIIRGLKTSLQRLDNEASLALRNYLTKQGIDYQLAPPHMMVEGFGHNGHGERSLGKKRRWISTKKATRPSKMGAP
jgi:hypothetical protein